MRIRYLLLFGCLFATQLALASGPTSPPSKITDVTVFLRGAQVSREARVTVHKGDNVIQFKGLASGIDARSIQAAAPPVVIINSVSHEVNYLQTQQPPRRVMLQQDSLELLKEQLERIKKEDLVLDLEKKMLLKNQSISGKETGLSIDELERAADFFRQRMTNINQIILKNQQKTQKIKLHTKQINEQLRVWNYKKKQPSNDIIVKIHSEYDRT
ncbi:MAG TPA: DUF4140 domain-containing protein, partial [Bacteroidetes bacterium]|nr:DUF4140 domain-containing protein [Bacteroidota bacterium]